MTQLTIKEIKDQLLMLSSLDDPLFETFSLDSRKGVQAAIKTRQKQLMKQEALLQAHHQKLTYERHIQAEGFTYIAGIDEVGRGPLAGPVVAASVILPHNCDALIGVNDSKQLSHDKRVQLSEIIMEVAIDYAIGIVEVADIDRLNIYEATKVAMQRSLDQLNIQPEYLLIDAMTLPNQLPQKAIIKGDAHSLSIAAASILAKVYRDKMMMDYHETFPEYEFATNMGYGTKNHLLALEKYGYLPIHRQSFSPVPQMNPRNF